MNLWAWFMNRIGTSLSNDPQPYNRGTFPSEDIHSSTSINWIRSHLITSRLRPHLYIIPVYLMIAENEPTFLFLSVPRLSLSEVIKSLWCSNQHLISLSIRLSAHLFVILMLTPYCNVDESAFANKFRSSVEWGPKSPHWMFLLNEFQRADCRSVEKLLVGGSVAALH